MCRPASFVLTKNEVYWGLTDSHKDIIEKNKLRESGVRGANVLRVEIVPPGGDMASPIESWKFGYDQDELPKWACREKDERRTRAALVAWHKARVFSGQSCEAREPGAYWVVGKGSLTACDGSTVTAYGSSTVTAYGSSTVAACDSSTVTAYDSSTVTAYGSSTVTAYDSSTVTAYDSSTVAACDSSTVTAYDSSTVTAYGSSTVVAYGSSTVTAYGSSTVAEASGSATVSRNSTSATVPAPSGPMAVVIDRTCDRAKCKVGK